MVLAAQAMPVAAQDRAAPATLEDLIPDGAVDDPDDWASTNGDGAQESAGDLAPDTPMEELPALQVEWPDDLDLPDPQPLAADDDAEIQSQLAQADELQLPPPPHLVERELGNSLVLGFPQDHDGFPEETEFVTRFRALSRVVELGGDPDQLAQLAARARADHELLQDLLRIYGYYDAQVIRTLAAIQPGEEVADQTPRVRFDILPGTRYTIGAIDLGQLASAPDYANLRAAFEIQPGDAVAQDRIVAERFDLDLALGEGGYPFASISDPALLIDHARQEGDLAMPVQPGGKYVFGQITSNLPRFMSGNHLQDIARFDPGETYQRSLKDDLRRAIMATGLVSSATVTMRESVPPSNGQPGVVDADVKLEKGALRTIAGGIGYGTEDGFKLETSWTHRNLFPPEGALKLRGIIGTREQLAGVNFTRNNFHARDQVLTLDAYATNITTEAVEARTLALRASFERLSNLLFQKSFSWAVGAEALYSDERNHVTGGTAEPRIGYLIGSLFARGQLDGSDSLLDPTRGYRAALYLAPEISRSSGAEAVYLRAQTDISAYHPVSDGVVLAARGRFASIQGAQIDDIAPSRRLYAGGGSSVRGYGYQAVGPRDGDGDPSGGRSLVEFSAEARIDTGLFDGALQVVPFFDLGSVSTGKTPDFGLIKYGAGLGMRYKTGFGPIRIDVGVPLNRDPEFDSPVAVYVSLGQAF